MSFHSDMSRSSSEPPAGFLHGCLVVKASGDGALLVVLRIHMLAASAVAAVHAGALKAVVVLLLLHAAAHVLLRPLARSDETILVGLSARVSELHCAILVCLGQALVAPGTGVLGRGQGRQ